MKRKLLNLTFAAAALTVAIQFTACKGKQTDKTKDTTITVADTSTSTAPVTIAADDELTKGVKDATKDFPGVKADVKAGEVTLTGNITRDRLQNLMMSLNSLHPKKINNQLTIDK
jgi:hypothetical protein